MEMNTGVEVPFLVTGRFGWDEYTAYFYGGVADRGRITPGLSELL